MSKDDKELLAQLKKEADMYGITYNHKSTVDSLTRKINAMKEAQDEGLLEVAPVSKSASDREKEQRAKALREATKLIRCEITCNDPKLRVRGQIFRNTRNKYLSLRKVIPLEHPTHVPQMILDSMRESKFLTFIKKKVNGQEHTYPKEVPTFNIRELPPLTKEEIERIAIRQQAQSTVGD